jgi:hypothetical protein
MSELFRSQNLARVHSQMGQQQQQFGLGSPQINTTGQHSGFHDQQGGQQNQAQMSANFGSVGMPNSAQLQASIHTRTPMPALGPSSIERQIEMLGRAQNQQHQNPQIGPPSFVNRLPQHQHQQASMNGQSGQSQGQSLFGSQSTDVNHGSPPHPTQTAGSMALQQGGTQPNAQGLPAGRRPMTLNELRERASYLRNYIAKQENVAVNMNNNRASIEPGAYMTQMGQLIAEVKIKKDLLTKVLQAVNAMTPQGQNNGNPNGSQGGNPGTM